MTRSLRTFFLGMTPEERAKVPFGHFAFVPLTDVLEDPLLSMAIHQPALAAYTYSYFRGRACVKDMPTPNPRNAKKCRLERAAYDAAATPAPFGGRKGSAPTTCGGAWMV